MIEVSKCVICDGRIRGSSAPWWRLFLLIEYGTVTLSVWTLFGAGPADSCFTIRGSTTLT